MNIDIFPHILPKKYFEAIQSTGPKGMLMAKRIVNVKPLHDVDTRLRIMDEYDNYQQVLTLGAPAIEAVAGPDVTPGLAQLGNDGMAARLGAGCVGGRGLPWGLLASALD